MHTPRLIVALIMIFAALAFGGTSAAIASEPSTIPLKEQCQAYPQIANQTVKAQCRVIRVRKHYQHLCIAPNDPSLTAGSPMNPCAGWPRIVRSLRVAAHYTAICSHDHDGVGIAGGADQYLCLGWRQRIAERMRKARQAAAASAPVAPAWRP